MTDHDFVTQVYGQAVSGFKPEWFNEKNSNWYNYVTNLPVREMDTYLVVVFHNQVVNGGFEQYFHNGYGQFAPETCDALNRIGAQKKASQLARAFELLNPNHYTNEIFRQKLLNQDIPILFVGGYYKLSQELEGEFEELLDKYDIDPEEDIVTLLAQYLNS